VEPFVSINKNVASFDSANNNVMQNVSYVKAWLAWYERKIRMNMEIRQ